MTPVSYRSYFSRKNKQRGAALLITLIFMLIISGIVVSSLGNKTLQTNLLSNFVRGEVSYQEARSIFSQLIITQQMAIKNKTANAIEQQANNCIKNATTSITVETKNEKQILSNSARLKYLGERPVLVTTKKPIANSTDGSTTTSSLRKTSNNMTTTEVEYLYDLETTAIIDNTGNKIFSTQHQGIVSRTFDICSGHLELLN